MLDNPAYIINFPTKRHWRGKSRIEDIEAGLEALSWRRSASAASGRSPFRRSAAASAGSTGASPPAYRGGAGAACRDVERRRLRAARARPNRSEAIQRGARHDGRPRGACRADAPVPGWPHGSVRDAAGSPQADVLHAGGRGAVAAAVCQGALRPYAENLRHVLREIEGYFVSGYADGGDAPDKQLEARAGRRGGCRHFSSDHPDTRAPLRPGCRLVEGFETPFGLELLSTVHWVATHEVRYAWTR